MKRICQLFHGLVCKRFSHSFTFQVLFAGCLVVQIAKGHFVNSNQSRNSKLKKYFPTLFRIICLDQTASGPSK